MGWNINLTLDKDVSEDIVDEICSSLPEDMRRPVGAKQEWGWSLAVDLRYRDSRLIGLSGSYGISGHIAQNWAERFADLLRKRTDCKIKISEMH